MKRRDEGAARPDFCWSFPAEPSAVREALRRAVACFAEEISADAAGTLELTLAEILNNVVEHGYAELAPGPVDLRIWRDVTALRCQITDHGHPMPGLKLPEGRMQPVAAAVEDLAEGGWGWALIRALASDLNYQRNGPQNRVTFRLPLLPN